MIADPIWAAHPTPELPKIPFFCIDGVVLVVNADLLFDVAHLAEKKLVAFWSYWEALVGVRVQLEEQSLFILMDFVEFDSHMYIEPFWMVAFSYTGNIP